MFAAFRFHSAIPYVLIVAVLFLIHVLPVFGRDASISFSYLLQKTFHLDSLWEPPVSAVQIHTSFDATGGNNDGKGYIRKEGEWYIIAEMKGPGAVTRIWSANPAGRIRIRLDGDETPFLDEKFRDLFLSRKKPFMRPFVRGTHDLEGSHWSYIPIPYRRSCEIAVSQPCYHQIESITFSAETEVEPLTIPPDSDDEKVLSEAAKLFRVRPSLPFAKEDYTQAVKISVSIPAGEIIDFATFTGPAVIKGIQMRWAGNEEDVGRGLLLLCYWDEEPEPSVIAPAFDFLGGNTSTIAVGKQNDGQRYCYFPMPFHQNACLALENAHMSGSVKVEITCYIQKVDELSDPLRTFHAWWTRDTETKLAPVTFNEDFTEPLCDPNRNFVSLNANGKGHVIGLSMIRTPSPQSDAMIFVDSYSYPPFFPGTGNDGFFDQAWEVQSNNWPLAGGVSDLHGFNSVMRLFLPAPYSFENGILIGFEHGHGNTKRCDYASTVYWYQEEPHNSLRWPGSPGARRFRTIPLTQTLFVSSKEKTTDPPLNQEEPVGFPVPSIEAEKQIIVDCTDIYEPQDMLPYGPDWSGNCQLRFEASGTDSSILFILPQVLFSGWYMFDCLLTQSPKGPVIDMQLDDQLLFTAVDLYSSSVKPRRLATTKPIFLHAADEPRLKIIVKGKNKKSNGHEIGIDCFQLTTQESFLDAIHWKGPLALLPSSTSDVPVIQQTLDKDAIVLGYRQNGQAEELMEETVIPTSSSTKIPMGQIIEDASMEECLLWVEGEIEVERTGIYRLQFEPPDVLPFLLMETEETIEPLIDHILLNNVILKGEETERFDACSNRKLPTFFHVPLHKGKNRMQWSLRCNPKTEILPKIYGLRKENRQ